MKTKHTLLFSGIVIIMGFLFVFENTQNHHQFDLAKREILIRKIGHELMLYAGDSTSRLLPVKKLADQTYQLQFEKDFAFNPDSLVSIIRKSLASNEQSDYVVTVLGCPSKEVVYGYAVSNEKKNDIIPCRGRNQPSGCYNINIKFDQNDAKIRKYATIPLLVIALLFSYFVFRFRKKKTNTEKLPDTNHLIKIGNITFDKKKKQLTTAKETINLTVKENKLLSIFAQNPNETIDRTRLQKEIWEDDGIIVGRSLDVFISKLRKKLESDPEVQLINVHGKGYKLQVKNAAF